jgi:hypothetical protein
MGLVSVYILISFLIHSVDDVGGVGVFIKTAFYGLLGGAAFLAPFFLGSSAIFLRRDLESGFFKYRVIFSVTCLILYASIMHLSHLSPEDSAEIGFSARLMFENGTAYNGGGVLGGYISEILRRSVGQIGAWIFILPLSFIFSIFLFGRTPLDLLRAIIHLVKDYQEAQKNRGKPAANKPAPAPREKREPARREKQPESSALAVPAVHPVSPVSIDIKADDFGDPFDDKLADLPDFTAEGADGGGVPSGRKRLIDIEPVMIPNKEIFQNLDNTEDEPEIKKDAESSFAEISGIIFDSDDTSVVFENANFNINLNDSPEEQQRSGYGGPENPGVRAAGARRRAGAGGYRF